MPEQLDAVLIVVDILITYIVLILALNVNVVKKMVFLEALKNLMKNHNGITMADRHELIKWKVITDWTAQGRGRLYCMNQGLAFPARKDNNGNTVPARFPIWFGPLKRKFKGFPDTFGFEFNYECGYKKRHPTHFIDCDSECHNCNEADVFTNFCTVEVKTIGDIVRPDQRRVMNELKKMGVRCYVAWEVDGDELYRLEVWEG